MNFRKAQRAACNHSKSRSFATSVICEQKWLQFELQNSPSRVFAFDGEISTAIQQTYEIGLQLKFLIFSE